MILVNSAFAVHNAMHSEASLKTGLRRRVGRIGADTTAINKKDKRNPVNMTTTLGKHRFGKGDRW